MRFLNFLISESWKCNPENPDFLKLLYKQSKFSILITRNVWVQNHIPELLLKKHVTLVMFTCTSFNRTGFIPIYESECNVYMICAFIAYITSFKSDFFFILRTLSKYRLVPHYLHITTTLLHCFIIYFKIENNYFSGNNISQWYYLYRIFDKCSIGKQDTFEKL